MNKYIVQHLGLGDHIITNGLIRSIIDDDPSNQYYLFVLNRYMESVKFMFRDIPNITMIGINHWEDRYRYLNDNRIPTENIIDVKYDQSSGIDFDRYFYESMGYPFEYRWSRFKCERDMERELDLFKRYKVEPGQYIFMHDDPSRSFEIMRNYIVNKDLPIIVPIEGLTENIFDYCYLMQHSAESHFIDSCFRLVFDSFKLRNDNIYYHFTLKNGFIKDTTTKSGSFLQFSVI